MIITKKSSKMWRKVLEKIWQSMDLNTIITTAVDELLTHLQIERCSFIWYSPETNQIEVVCDRIRGVSDEQSSLEPINDDLFKQFERFTSEIAAGKLVVKHNSLNPIYPIESDEWVAIQKPKLLERSNPSCLLVPVKSHTNLLGYISCFERPRTDLVKPRDRIGATNCSTTRNCHSPSRSL